MNAKWWNISQRELCVSYLVFYCVCNWHSDRLSPNKSTMKNNSPKKAEGGSVCWGGYIEFHQLMSEIYIFVKSINYTNINVRQHNVTTEQSHSSQSAFQVDCTRGIHQRGKCQLRSIVLRGYYTGNWFYLIAEVLWCTVSFTRQAASMASRTSTWRHHVAISAFTKV